MRGGAGKHLGMAEIGPRRRAEAALRRIVIDIMDDDQVEPAVAIEIDKAGRSGPMDAIETRFLGDLRKRAVAIVEKQPHAAVFGQHDVGPTVVVHVADRHAHVVAVDSQAGFIGHVLEAAVGQLLKKLVTGRGIGPAVLQQVNVEKTVVIEIEQGGAGAHDLRHEITADRPGVVDEIEADLLRYVGERSLVLGEFVARLGAPGQEWPSPHCRQSRSNQDQRQADAPRDAHVTSIP